MALGPDGRVWLGEAGRISRTAIGPAGAPVRLQTVIDGLPASGAHPFKEIVFGASGKLYLNVGSASDACRDDGGKQAVPCPETEAPGVRPLGAPTGLAIDRAGRLLVVEDRHKTLLMLARDER